MTAFADVYVNGGEAITGEVTKDQIIIGYTQYSGSVDVTVKEGSSDPQYVSVSKAGEKLNLNYNNVTGDSNENNPTIHSSTDDYGQDGTRTSAVSVGGNVNETGTKNAVEAHDHGEVNIEGNVTEAGDGHAVDVNNGSNVTVKGKVDESYAGDAIHVTSTSGTDASTTVKVYGDVIEKGEGIAIYANGEKTNVIVLGDVTSDGKAIDASISGEVVVEGVVTGDVKADASSDVYIGKLNGNIDSDASKGSIHYLIGLADGSYINNSLILTDTTGCIAEYGVKSADGRAFRYTTTADPAALSGKSFNLKSPDSKKKLIIQGIAADADVNLVSNADGSVTLTLGSNFKGGLQKLKLIFENIIVRNSSGGSSKPIFTGSKSNPVTNGKWTQNADGTWSYATTYKFTNEWACIAKPGEESSASWYYFDRNGNMLTGWQEIFWNGAKTWFYFIEAKGAEEGKCLINGITPDGYRVGPDGAWIQG